MTDTLDEGTAIHLHAEERVSVLGRDEMMSLTLLLHDLLVSRMYLKHTDAAKIIGETVGESHRTVREWRATLVCNGNSFPESQQGKYQ